MVDDNDFNTMALRSVLNENFSQVEVHEAINGEEAVKKFKEEFDKECGCENRLFKVIFMDIQMPVMDGITASQKIVSYMKDKVNGQELPCRIFAVTAYTDEKTMRQCKQAGISEVHNKPLPCDRVHIIMYLYFYRLSLEACKPLYERRFGRPFVEQPV